MENTALQKHTETSSAVVPADVSAAALEMAVGMGDFTRLSPADRLRYIAAVCQSTRLNALTLPFRIIKMDGKDVLYATADCGAQLRSRDKLSIELTNRSFEHGCVIVTARAATPDGRKDEATGAVALTYPEKIKEWRNGQGVYVAHPKSGQPLEGLEFANAIKKAETQAKRRVALSICGLGIPDESELEAMAPKISDVIHKTLSAETVEDIALRFNQDDTAPVKKETAIEAEIVTEAKPVEFNPETGYGKPVEREKQAVTAPQASALKPEALQQQRPTEAPEEDPFQEPPPEASNPSEQTPEEKMAMELEKVFAAGATPEFGRDCLEFCVVKGKLVKGKSLETINQLYAKQICTNPDGFKKAVTAWVKGGKK